VWIGYADGHLEFAPNQEAFDAARRQLAIAQRVQSILEPRLRAARQPTTHPATPPTGELTLRILDPQGRPVAGAMLGQFAERGNKFLGYPHTRFADQHQYLIPYSDSEGLATIPASAVFQPGTSSGNSQSLTVVILDEAHGWMALKPIRRDEFGDRGQVRDVRLQSACRVSASISNVSLTSSGGTLDGVLGEPLHEAGGFLEWNISSSNTGSRFELLLPPGDYKLSIKGVDCVSTMHYAHISQGQRELNLRIDLDLPSAVVQNFANKPAPEFDLRAWRNTAPLKLSDLRGRVVLLDFWGYWCGPCVAGMPRLMSIYDELHPRGLEVIALHDNSVTSFAELDPKLARTRQEMWRGRDLPFPVAIDGGPQTAADGAYRGATAAAYNVHVFPTTLLIDREGMLIEQIDLENPHAREEILRALGKPTDAAR
jgi:thiol-disulfide isomerase/thioredoxin